MRTFDPGPVLMQPAIETLDAVLMTDGADNRFSQR